MIASDKYKIMGILISLEFRKVRTKQAVWTDAYSIELENLDIKFLVVNWSTARRCHRFGKSVGGIFRDKPI